MAQNNIVGPAGAYSAICNATDIVPGSPPSYQLAKLLYTYHPHGAKIVDWPIRMAQHKGRNITFTRGPAELLKARFEEQWKRDRMTKVVRAHERIKRMYGAATTGLMVAGLEAKDEADYKKLWGERVSFNAWDPLNTAGSLVLNQDPNSMDFLKVSGVAVAGVPYHPSRTITTFNEDPIYIQWESSAFGYTGRSVYQRALQPMQAFLATMNTNMMIAIKAGVLIAKIKQQSSIVDNVMRKANEQKRNVVLEAQTYNVINISPDEMIESINFQNLEAPFTMARKNIIEDEAAGAGIPAKLLLSETFAEGFGEGTEDAKHIAEFVDDIREEMEPVYDWADQVTLHRAINPDFFKMIQEKMPEEYGGMEFETAFYEWTNSYKFEWPNLLEEPDSEKVKTADVALKGNIGMIEALVPLMDPENAANMIEVIMENINELTLLFPTPFEIDIEALTEYLLEQKENADALAKAQQEAETEPGSKNKFADAVLPYPKALKKERLAKAVRDFETSVLKKLEEAA